MQGGPGDGRGGMEALDDYASVEDEIYSIAKAFEVDGHSLAWAFKELIRLNRGKPGQISRLKLNTIAKAKYFLLLGMVHSGRYRRNEEECDVLFVCSSNIYRRTYNKYLKKRVLGFDYFENVLNGIRDRYRCMVVTHGYPHYMRYWSFLSNGPADSFVPLELYVEARDVFEGMALARKVAREGGLTRDFAFKIGVDGMIWHRAWERLFKRFTPRLVVFIDEYQNMSYLGLTTAKAMGIRTMALQHGNLSARHGGYCHNPRYVGDRSDAFILPEITMVQGEDERRVFRYLGAEKKVRVTGQPRYDFLGLSEQVFDAAEIRGRLGLPDKRVILWATQSHALSREENRRNVEVFLHDFEKLKDRYHLVIKLHPSEDQAAPLYRSFLEKGWATVLDGRQNTYELIALSYVTVVKHSTVATEAIAMGRPVVLTDTVPNPKLSLYTDYGFDLILRRKGDLAKAVELTESGKYHERYEKLRARFLEDKLSSIGKATENVISEIEALIQER